MFPEWNSVEFFSGNFILIDFFVYLQSKTLAVYAKSAEHENYCRTESRFVPQSMLATMRKSPRMVLRASSIISTVIFYLIDRVSTHVFYVNTKHVRSLIASRYKTIQKTTEAAARLCPLGKYSKFEYLKFMCVISY